MCALEGVGEGEEVGRAEFTNASMCGLRLVRIS